MCIPITFKFGADSKTSVSILSVNKQKSASLSAIKFLRPSLEIGPGLFQCVISKLKKYNSLKNIRKYKLSTLKLTEVEAFVNFDLESLLESW